MELGLFYILDLEELHLTIKKYCKAFDGYVNLEFDLDSGKRGDRQSHIRDHLSSICGSESSLCVNNNAASVVIN